MQVAQWVREGVLFTFINGMTLYEVLDAIDPAPDSANNMPAERAARMDAAIAKALASGIIGMAPDDAVATCTVFLQQSATTGKWRFILDGRPVNAFLDPDGTAYELPLLADILNVVNEGTTFCKLDVRSAYPNIAVHPRHRRLVTFMWRGAVYAFWALPFGIAPSGFYFVRVFEYVLSKVSLPAGVAMVAYIDDVIVIISPGADAVAAMRAIVAQLDAAGFIIADDKGPVMPSAVCEILGLEVCASTMRVYVPTRKRNAIKRLCSAIIAEHRASRRVQVRQLARLAGKIAAGAPAWRSSPVLYRQLFDAIAAGNFSRLRPTAATLRIIQHWRARVDSADGRLLDAAWRRSAGNIYSDASNVGLGAAFGQSPHDDSLAVSTPHDIGGDNINKSEMLGALFALRSFGARVAERAVTLYTDNMTVRRYLRRGGPVAELQSIATTIVREAERLRTRLTVEHVAGIENTAADRASRRYYNEEYNNMGMASAWAASAASAGDGEAGQGAQPQW